MLEIDDETFQQIREMSDDFTEDAIAAACKMPVSIVRSVLAGDASITQVAKTEHKTLLNVASKKSYRQMVIAVWRGGGGVGCTTIALHLALALGQMMRVLIIDMTPAMGGSDLGNYLGQPDYPNLGAYLKTGYLESATVQIDPMVWALLPSTAVPGKDTLTRLIMDARRQFDAILLDLPNSDMEYVREAVVCSNALVMVTGGKESEMERVFFRLADARKDRTVLVGNGAPLGRDLAAEFGGSVEIPQDRDLLKGKKVMEALGKKGSPLTVGAEKIRDTIYKDTSKEDGGIRRVFNMFLKGGG